MKKLLNTLYVTTEDSYLSLDGENVVVWRDGKRVGRFPLHVLGGIAYFGYRGASPQLLGECARRGVDFSFFTPKGRFLARITKGAEGNVLMRKEQYRIADNPERSVSVARNFIVGKIYNSRWVIERARRDHPLQIDFEVVSERSKELATLIIGASNAQTLEELRGIEGSAARAYYSVFNELILSNKDVFIFEGRNRRPPKDPVNAMLSFAYSLLTNDCAAALEGVGLDAYVGFMHSDRPGRKSLALDLVEELRSVFADRVVLTGINNRVFIERHFDWRADGGTYLTEEGRKVFLEAWQAKKREIIKHPFTNEKIHWGLIPHIQALLLARYIRGDLDGYPPFLWK